MIRHLLRALVLLLALGVAASPRTSAQMLGTTADLEDGISASAGFYVEQFGFLDLRGATVRGEMSVTSRIAPFAELGIARFEAELPGNGSETETSWLLGAGAKVYALGERQLGVPLSIAGYTRLQFGALRNIDLFSTQALLLGTYDLTDSLPLVVQLGAGISYRRTDAEGLGGVRVSENHTRGRWVLGVETPLNPKLAVLAEFAYEDRGAGGLGVRYRP